MAFSRLPTTAQSTAYAANQFAIRKQKPNIKLYLDDNLKQRIFKLDTNLAIWDQATREDKIPKFFVLTLDLFNKNEFTFAEWEKEYYFICALCGEKELTNERLEKRKAALLTRLSEEDRLTLEDYKRALQNAGNVFVSSKELKVNISRLKDNLFKLACLSPMI